MTWQPRRQHEGGYLMIDHRASPGLPEEVARASGFDPALTGEGKLYETQTLTCSHCRVVQAKNRFRIRPRAYCPKCDHYICDLCNFRRYLPNYTHTPYERVIDAAFAGRPITLMGSPAALLKG